MIQLIVFSTLAVLTAAVDDTPYNNFTQDLAELEGPLVVPTADTLSDDKSLYEGRWYAAYVGLREEQVKNLSCVVFDAFFDKDGDFHSFFNIKDNGKTRVVIAEKKPDKPEDGIYDLFLGQPEDEKMKGVLYYVDKDVIALWDGLDAGDKHYQNLIVGFRDLRDVVKKEPELSKIYSSLVKKEAESEKNAVSHVNCKYPEAISDPYKSK